jgi:acyl-CoA thioesterase
MIFHCIKQLLRFTDFTLMTTALRPHGLSYISPSLQCASIDHAIYFHRCVLMNGCFMMMEEQLVRLLAV